MNFVSIINIAECNIFHCMTYTYLQSIVLYYFDIWRPIIILYSRTGNVFYPCTPACRVTFCFSRCIPSIIGQHVWGRVTSQTYHSSCLAVKLLEFYTLRSGRTLDFGATTIASSSHTASDILSSTQIFNRSTHQWRTHSTLTFLHGFLDQFEMTLLFRTFNGLLSKSGQVTFPSQLFTTPLSLVIIL
jgi:hypothetical protein